jgi:hypothetical protein
MESRELEPREKVLRGYGEVMQVVQQWEQALETVWWRVAREHPNRASGDSDTERSQREIVRLERALQKMTAKMVAEDVAPHLAPETAEGLEMLSDDRNRLAHRFLMERADIESAGDFRPGTHAELLQLGARFMPSLESIAQTIGDFPDYDGPVPAHWPALADRIVRLAFSGQPIPRDPREQ